MHEIHKSVLAERDLTDIWLYTAGRWGEDQADHYLDRIAEALDLLATHPDIGSDCSDIRAGYRKFRAGRHLIFYRLADNTLYVVRVLHDQMDIERHL